MPEDWPVYGGHHYKKISQALILLVLAGLLMTGCGANLPTAATAPDTPTVTAIPTSTATAAMTATSTSTATPLPPATATVTPTPTATPDPTLTPTPTPSPSQTATVVASLPPELAQWTGRSLAEIETELMEPGYISQTQVFTENQVAYHTVIYQPADFMDSTYNSNHLLIYKLAEGQFVPLFHLEKPYRMQFREKYDSQSQTSDWFDMNGDGLLELAYVIINGGTCWGCTQRQVLQRGGDDRISLMTPVVGAEDEFSQNWVLRDLIDADNDGILEWVMFKAGLESAFSLCKPCSPVSYRLYAWNGEQYINASDRFPGYYQEQIDELTTELTQMSQNEEQWRGNEVGQIISLLLAYDNAGRRDEGWPIFEQYANPNLYTGRAAEDFLNSLQEAHDYYQARYEAGQPF